MNFHETSLPGAFVVDLQRIEDERGFFARSWCRQEFRERGLSPDLAQCNISFNHRAGTLRGMHYQTPPHAEAKLVRCTMGAVFDVIVDLRKHSPTFRQWFGIELTATNRHMLYIPQEFAHGFLSLVDGSEVFYQMSHPFVAGSGAGIRWNDPAIGIRWPFEPAVISDRDRAYPDLFI